MGKTYGRFNYAQPSFIEGMARIFDFAGALDVYHTPQTDAATQRADTIALREAWVEVGQCMWDAIGQFEEIERDNLDAARESQWRNRTK